MLLFIKRVEEVSVRGFPEAGKGLTAPRRPLRSFPSGGTGLEPAAGNAQDSRPGGSPGCCRGSPSLRSASPFPYLTHGSGRCAVISHQGVTTVSARGGLLTFV